MKYAFSVWTKGQKRSLLGKGIMMYIVMILMVSALPIGSVDAQDTPKGFTKEIRISKDAADSYFPQIMVDASDNIHIIWLNSTSRDLDNLRAKNGQIYYTKISAYGEVLIPQKKVSSIYPEDGGSYSINPPSADIDTHGNIHVAWADDHSGTFTIYYMKMDLEGNPKLFVNGLTNTTSAQYPDLDVDNDGNIHLAWAQWELYGQSQTWPNIYYTKIDGQGNTLVPRIAVTSTFLASNHPAISVDRALRAHIVFEENVNLPGNTDDIYYCVVDKDGNLDLEMQRISSSKGSSLRPDIEIDQLGIPNIVWMDNQIEGSMDIYYTNLNDISNIKALRISDTKGESNGPVLKIGKGHDIHIIWSQNIYVGPIENSQIWYAIVGDGQTIKKEAMRLTYEGLGAKAPSLAMDSNNNVIVTWDDYRFDDDSGEEVWDIYYMRSVVGTNLEPVEVLEIDGEQIESGKELTFNLGDEVVLYAGNSTDPNSWDQVDDYNYSITHDNFTIASGWTTNSTFIYKFEDTGAYIIFVKVRDHFGYKNSIPKAVLVNVVPKKLTKEPSILVSPIVQGSVVAGGIGMTTITLGYLIGWTEIGKFKFVSLMVLPLYSRIKKEKTLDNYIRGQIHGYVLAKPGCHYNQIKQTLNLNNGTLAYHLRKLEREEFIKSERDGMYKRFYPIGLKIPKRKIKLSEMQRTILNVIGMNPGGISQKEVAKEVGISAPAVIYHIGVLAGAKLVKREKKGSRVEYKLIEVSEDGDEVAIGSGAPAAES